MDIHIDLEIIKFFISVVVVGILYGIYCYRRGLRRGWDNAIYNLERGGYLYVDDNGEVCRYNDKEYRIRNIIK